MMAIDDAGRRKHHDRIRVQLLDAINGGQLQPGAQIPSEWELAERFGVSRMTVRHALSDLEARGYLERRRGKGTFVNLPKLEQPLAGLTSFTDEMRRRGLNPGTQVLSVEEQTAERCVAEALGISDQARVYRVERLRLADDLPMAIETSHIPVSRAPGLPSLGALTQSLYLLLQERYSLRLTQATQVLEVVTAGARERELLLVREGTPLMLLVRIARDAAGHPVEYVRSFYRGDRYRFTAEIFR